MLAGLQRMVDLQRVAGLTGLLYFKIYPTEYTAKSVILNPVNKIAMETVL